MKDIDLLTVGYHKGEIDFSICGAVSDLSREELAQSLHEEMKRMVR